MKVNVKKVVLVGAQAILVATSANAITIAPSSAGSTATVVNGSCGMVSANSGFNFVTSANVGVAYICDPTSVAVQAGNQKGKFVFGGGSQGGSVKQCGTTAVDTSTGYKATPGSATTDGCS